jgi:hypothetical protein
MNDQGKVAAVGGEKDIFLTINGMKIAKHENYQWTSLVPGYKVRDYGDLDGISVEVDRSPRTPRARTPRRRRSSRGPARTAHVEVAFPWARQAPPADQRSQSLPKHHFGRYH